MHECSLFISKPLRSYEWLGVIRAWPGAFKRFGNLSTAWPGSCEPFVGFLLAAAVFLFLFFWLAAAVVQVSKPV